MKRFSKENFDPNDYRGIEIAASITRVILMPIAFVYAVYLWTWDTIFKLDKYFDKLIDKL